MKIWLGDGRIVYSSNKELIGTVHVHERLMRAWEGHITAAFDDIYDDNGSSARDDATELLEVYAPIYSDKTGKVIAVAEFYELADEIHGDLARVRWECGIVTALLASAMVLALFSIVADGSRTIQRQRNALTQRVAELSGLLQQNEILHDRLKRSAQQVIEDHESFLHQIGADLHDGPAQLVGLALLRLDQLKVATDQSRIIRDVLFNALGNIRDISAGLLLPEARDQSLADALLQMVRDHERHTQTTVRCDIDDLSLQPPRYMILCLCRIVQEGLANAFRHAEGKGQSVSVKAGNRAIRVEVCDTGPGIGAHRVSANHKHLGLLGLRRRIESIGGTLTVESRPQGGTRLMAQLPLIDEE
jgi:signal transduction histidine kinase